MTRLLTPDSAIDALEEIVIKPASKVVTPTLGCVIAEKNDLNKADWVYLKQLTKCANKYGAEIEALPCSDLQGAYKNILELKNNPRIDGIIVLSSFKKGDDQFLKNYIPMPLDIDCASAVSLGHMLYDRSETFYRGAPCTAGAIYKLLTYNGIDVTGKRVGVVGRSPRVGRPVSQLMSIANATVTLYHSKSDLSSLTQEDVVISAIGKPKFLKANLFREGQIVVDAGINVDENGKLCGDVDYDEVYKVLGDSGAITPVPNGVGPLTNVVLFSKLFANKYTIRGYTFSRGADS